MRKLKTGKLLWETIEAAAREKWNLSDDYELRMIDLGNEDDGECECRMKHKESEKFRRGFVSFKPYVMRR